MLRLHVRLSYAKTKYISLYACYIADIPSGQQIEK